MTDILTEKVLEKGVSKIILQYIQPRKEIVNPFGELKKEVESIKKNSGDTSSKDLMNNMGTLTKSMSSMLNLFKEAADEMRAEESTEEKLASQVSPLMNKLDTIIDQNKTNQM